MKATLLTLLASAIAGQDVAPTHNGIPCRPLVKGTVYSCAGADDLFHFANFTMPPALKRGERFEIHIQGQLNEPVVHGSKIHVKVHVGYLRLYSGEEDLCAAMQASKGELRCPVAPGAIDYKYSDVIPRLPFGGSFKIEATGLSPAKKQIFLLKSHIKIH